MVFCKIIHTVSQSLYRREKILICVPIPEESPIWKIYIFARMQHEYKLTIEKTLLGAYLDEKMANLTVCFLSSDKVHFQL